VSSAGPLLSKTEMCPRSLNRGGGAQDKPEPREAFSTILGWQRGRKRSTLRARDDNMQTILPSEFKRQMVVMLEGSPHIIEDMHTSGTAQTRHRLHTRLRHLTTGRVIDRVFAENERVPVAPLETRRVTYSYAQADARVFIDIETFDEFEFSNEQLGERIWFLKENEEYKALRLDGRLLDIVLPPQISLKVVDTAPPTRTGLNAAWKEAKLETGLQIMVPLFITSGDIIRVDTAERKYLGKDTSGE